MRLILAIMGFLLLMFTGTYWILFTHSGNNIIRPYIETQLENKLQKDIILNSLTLKPTFIDIEATIDSTSKLIVNGNIDILDKWFDIKYKIDAKDLKTPVLTIRDNLAINGSAKGFLHEFSLNGSGLAFKSKVRFATSVKDGKPVDLHVDAKGIQLEEMLELANQPIYTSGVADVVINGKETNGKIKGNSDVKVHIGRLNNALIKKDFNIQLPPNTTYKGTINALINGEMIEAKSDIFTTLARIKTNKTQVDLRTKSLTSDYDVMISNLQDWESILNKKLYGNLQILGNVKVDEDGTKALDAHIKNFGGSIDAILVDSQLEATIKDVEIRDVLSMLGEPAISYGNIDATAKFTDIRPKQTMGTLHIEVKDGELIGEQAKKLSNIDFPQTTNYALKSEVHVDRNLVDFKSTLNSTIGDIPNFQGVYDLDKEALISQYALHVKDLGNLTFITKRKLKGSLEAIGNIEQSKDSLKITARSDLIDSNTTMLFENSALHVNSKDVSFEKLSNMLDVPYIFDANGSMVFDYNVETKQGSFDINASNGRMVDNELVDTMIAISKVDLRKEIYDNAYIKGNIDNTNVRYISLLKSEHSMLSVKEGTYDTLSQKIKAPFDLKIEHRDFSGEVEGNIKSPKVSIDSSEYLKKKIDHAIDKHVPENAKGLIKDILKLF